MSDAVGWRIVLHGGAKEIPEEEQPNHRAGVARALASGVDVLGRGGSALDAVETVVRVLEDDPVFNAGSGSVKNAKGEIEMDASIMDGSTLEIGAVAGLQGFRNPVRIARAMVREKPILLVGHGAVEFAKRHGAEQLPSSTSSKSTTNASDTVGCVARDARGDFAAALSSGGLEGAEVGRVGDVPMPGGGFYADNSRGAVALSGEGEAIARVMMASEVLGCMTRFEPQQAVEAALRLSKRVDGEAGIIAISPTGEIGWTHNSPHFAVALARAEAPDGAVFLSRGEFA